MCCFIVNHLLVKSSRFICDGLFLERILVEIISTKNFGDFSSELYWQIITMRMSQNFVNKKHQSLPQGKPRATFAC